MKKRYAVVHKKSESSSGHMGSKGVIAGSYWAVVIEPFGIDVKVFDNKAEAEQFAIEKNNAC